MPVTFKSLSDMRRAHYILPAYRASRPLFIIGATTMYLGGVGYAEGQLRAGDPTIWTVLALATLIYLLVLKQFLGTGRKPQFGCDQSGVYLHVAKDKYLFVPWGRVHNITLDGGVMWMAPVLVVDLSIDDEKLAPQMAAAYPLDLDTGKKPGGATPWGPRRVRLGVPFRAVSPARELNRIYRMREQAGPDPFA